VRTRALPSSIVYAAAPSSWHDAPALGQLVFDGLVRLGGDRALVVAVAFAAVAVDLRRRDADDAAGAAVLIALLVAAPASLLVVRAQLFSIALFPVLLALLRHDAGWRSRRIWLCVPIIALWANLHGAVLVGFAALAAYLVLDRARRAPLESFAVLGASAAALLATPALLDTPRYYSGVLHGEAAAERFGLWAPLDPGDPLDLLFLVGALVLLVLALRARPALWELVLVALFAAAAIEARRNGIWLLLLIAPHAARGLRRRRSVLGLVRPRLAAVCLAAPVALAALSFARPPAHDGASDALLGRAQSAAHGSPILADPLDAERLALRGARIVIGNPLDAFERERQKQYLAWLRGERAGDALLRAPVRVVVVSRRSDAQRRLAL